MNEFAVAVESENAKSPAKWGGYISRACWKRTSELTVCDKNHSVFLQLRFITNALALSTRKVRGKHFSVFILFFCPRNWWDCLKLKKRHALLMDSQFAQRESNCAIVLVFVFNIYFDQCCCSCKQTLLPACEFKFKCTNGASHFVKLGERFVHRQNFSQFIV